MRRVFVAFLILNATASAQGEQLDLSFLAGTYEVNFVPMVSGGTTIGCALQYKSVVIDHVYRQGAPIAAVGNIVYTLNQSNMPIFALKLGIGSALDANAPVIAPYFAYLKSPRGTTGNTLYSSQDSDVPGYRLFIYRFNKESASVLEDILKGSPLIIGFNHSKNGLDVFVPIDLEVSGVTMKNGILKRIRSKQAISDFDACFLEVTKKSPLYEGTD